MNRATLHQWNGGGEPSTLLALHGWGGSGLDFAPLAHASSDGWRAPDLLGHGLSPVPEEVGAYGLESQIATVESALQTGDFLLGYSMGGRLALHAALKTAAPLRGLILIGASPGLREGPEKETRRQWDFEQAEAIERDGARSHMETWQSHPLIASQARLVDSTTYQYMMNRRREANGAGLAASMRGFGAGTMPDCWGALSGLKTPTLLVVGAEDARYRSIAEEMQSLLPNAHVLIVPNAGHAAHLENPADFLDGVHHWMAGR